MVKVTLSILEECFYALLFMLTVVYAEYHKLSLYTILSVIMLNVVMLNVVAPLI